MSALLEPPVALAIVAACLLLAIASVAYVWLKLRREDLARRRSEALLASPPCTVHSVAPARPVHELFAGGGGSASSPHWAVATAVHQSEAELGRQLHPAVRVRIARGLRRRRWPDQFVPGVRGATPWPEADELFVGELALPVAAPLVRRTVTCVGGIVREWELTR